MPFYWSQATGMIMIGNDFTHSGFGLTRDINNHGLAVRQWRNRAFTWSRTSGYAELPLLPGAFVKQNEAMAVNDNGVVVGRSNGADAFPKPVRWREGSVEELAVPGGKVGVANDVNARGLVVGEAENGRRQTRPVAWTGDGSVHEIPMVPATPALDMGFAEGVNDRDDIIGWDASSAFGDGRQVGWIRDASGRLTVLNDVIDPASGWDIRVPLDINSRGQIVGIGIRTVDGVTYPGRAFLMTPA